MINFHIYVSEFWCGFIFGMLLFYGIYRFSDFMHFMNSPYIEGSFSRIFKNKRS